LFFSFHHSDRLLDHGSTGKSRATTAYTAATATAKCDRSEESGNSARRGEGRRDRGIIDIIGRIGSSKRRGQIAISLRWKRAGIGVRAAAGGKKGSEVIAACRVGISRIRVIEVSWQASQVQERQDRLRAVTIGGEPRWISQPE